MYCFEDRYTTPNMVYIMEMEQNSRQCFFHVQVKDENKIKNAGNFFPHAGADENQVIFLSGLIG